MPTPQKHSAEYLTGFVERRYLGFKGTRHHHGPVGFACRLLQGLFVHVSYSTRFRDLNQAEMITD